VAVIAGLYPLWGALSGGLVPFHFLGQDKTLSTSRTLLILLVWLLLSVIEERVFRIPFGRHILGAAALGVCWFPLLWHKYAYGYLLDALASQTVSRAAAIALAWISRPNKRGMSLTRNMNSVSAGIALACGGVGALLQGPRRAGMIVAVSFLITRAIRGWYYRDQGGINPTALSLTQRASELSTLLIAVFVQ
jgi:hypothetical protein